MVRGSDVAFVRARHSIELRDLFPEGAKPGDGNYVSTFVISVDSRGGLDAMLPEIDAETKHAIERFTQRETVLGELSSEAQTWIGRKLLGRIALASKVHDRLPRQSFHLSNLGRMDAFGDGAIQIEAIFPSLPHTNLFIGAIGFRGSLLLTLNYPRGEISDEFMRTFAAELDDLLAELGEGAPSKQAGQGAVA
jgi:hypothetical protein